MITVQTSSDKEREERRDHWVLYDVDDRHELYVAAEFYGTRTEVNKKYPMFLPRLKVWST